MYKKIYDTPQEFEGPFGPSMVEPCHNLSLEELVRDYTRGIVHSERPAYYDDGDELPEDPPFFPTDISEVLAGGSPERGGAPKERPTSAERDESGDSNEAEELSDEAE